MKSRFNVLFESNFTRFQGGGFLTGDVIRLKDGWENDDWCKSAAPQLVDALKELDDSDLLLRVSSVKAIRPAVNSSIDQALGVDDFHVDIAQEIAPGKFSGKFVTVPQHLIMLHGDNATLPEVPESLKRQEKIDVKPVELEQAEAGDDADVDKFTKPGFQTKTEDKVNHELTDKNIEQPGATGAESYTAKYIS